MKGGYDTLIHFATLEVLAKFSFGYPDIIELVTPNIIEIAWSLMRS